MNVGWLFILVSFLMLVHHFHVHGHWYDAHDIRRMKVKSHEFWEILLASLGLIVLSI